MGELFIELWKTESVLLLLFEVRGLRLELLDPEGVVVFVQKIVLEGGLSILYTRYRHSALQLALASSGKLLYQLIVRNFQLLNFQTLLMNGLTGLSLHPLQLSSPLLELLKKTYFSVQVRLQIIDLAHQSFHLSFVLFQEKTYVV